MNAFILDNSITMRWLFSTNNQADQQYAENVLQTLSYTQALVPNLWHLEVANVLSNGIKRGDVLAGNCEVFLTHLQALPIRVDELTATRAFSRTFNLAEHYALSSYDAAYLELAIRQGLPLATLDKALAEVAKKLGVRLYLRQDLRQETEITVTK